MRSHSYQSKLVSIKLCSAATASKAHFLETMNDNENKVTAWNFGGHLNRWVVSNAYIDHQFIHLSLHHFHRHHCRRQIHLHRLHHHQIHHHYFRRRYSGLHQILLHRSNRDFFDHG